jgi:hypothetical protein
LPSCRRGTAAAVVAVVVVAMVIGAAGAYFFLVAPASPGASGSRSSAASTGTTQAGSTTAAASSTGGASTTSACTTATSTSTYNPLNFTGLFSEFPGMATRYNGTYDGNGVNESAVYRVVSATGAGFKVNVTLSSGRSVAHYTDYALANGTAAAVLHDGVNYTGSYAEDLFVVSMSTYYLSDLFGQAGVLGELKAGGLVHSAGSANETIGSTAVSVTTYEPNALPLVEDECGSTADFTNFTLSTGTVAGRSTVLLTSMRITGSFASQGTSQSLDVSLVVTSISTA